MAEKAVTGGSDRVSQVVKSDVETDPIRGGSDPLERCQLVPADIRPMCVGPRTAFSNLCLPWHGAQTIDQFDDARLPHPAGSICTRRSRTWPLAP